jgi:hypothetical protein
MEEPPDEEPPITEPPPAEEPEPEPEPPVEEPPNEEPPITEPPPSEEPEPEPEPPVEEPPNDEPAVIAEAVPPAPGEEPAVIVEAVPPPIGAATVRERSNAPETDRLEPDAERAAPESEPISDAPATAEVRGPNLTEPMRLTVEPETETAAPAFVPEPAAVILPTSTVPLQAHWLLSLFTPAAGDAVDWARGSYTVLARGGRIDSPSGSGELKKQIQMVAEGSVLYADGVPLGAAADVAPDGFAHPVFRAGFALAIPLPEVH